MTKDQVQSKSKIQNERVPSLNRAWDSQRQTIFAAQLSPSEVPIMSMLMGDGLRIFVSEYTTAQIRLKKLTDRRIRDSEGTVSLLLL